MLRELEEVRDRSQGQDIGVKVDDFSEVLLKTEYVKFCQGRMQIRSTCKE